MTPGMALPASLTSWTVSRVPLLAVTRTGPLGLMPLAPGGGAIDSAAGTIGDGRGATCGTGAAVSVWQWSAQRGVPVTTRPPSTASTARTTARQAPRTRRVDVNCSPLWFGDGREGSILDIPRRHRRNPSELGEFVIVLLRG